MIIFAADDPCVLDGTYDREGFTPKERRHLARHQQETERHKTEGNGYVPAGRVHERKSTMRFFDSDNVGCYLDAIDHRVEKTKDGGEVKMVDLTLRVQPFTPAMAVSLDPDVRALLFTMGDATPKPKLKAIHFALTVPHQRLAVTMVPEVEARVLFTDCEIGGVRARTEKGVDGFALIFYAAYGPASPTDLEYICDWLTQQRFITFHPEAPALDFAGATGDKVEPARQMPRRNKRGAPPVEAGDELRPGVHAEH